MFFGGLLASFQVDGKRFADFRIYQVLFCLSRLATNALTIGFGGLQSESEPTAFMVSFGGLATNA
jgi:hypothetical protein